MNFGICTLYIQLILQLPSLYMLDTFNNVCGIYTLMSKLLSNYFILGG